MWLEKDDSEEEKDSPDSHRNVSFVPKFVLVRYLCIVSFWVVPIDVVVIRRHDPVDADDHYYHHCRRKIVWWDRIFLVCDKDINIQSCG
jgi:hypothetical protein